MQIFINEVTLNAQFSEDRFFFDSLRTFISSIVRINEIKNNKNIFKSDYLFYYSGVPDRYLEQSLRANPQLNQLFVLNLQKVNPRSWQKEKIHEDNSTYEFDGKNYSQTSVAEIAERKNTINEFTGFLLNFTNSQFGNSHKIEILKNNTDCIEVDCAITPDSIEQWLVENGYLNPEEVYDETLGIAPKDIQTVLRDSTIFEKTHYPKNNGRTVYRKIGTNELWAVDSAPKHAGVKAHIEVFDETTGKHLGTSLYNEINLNRSFKVTNRYITLE